MRSSRSPALDPVLPAPPRFRAPRLMGVVNVTPDSLYAGSRTPSTESAVERALRLVDEGADLLDVGGQSSRPGSQAVPLDLERARVIPVVAALARRPGLRCPISVDTDKARIAEEALGAGARIVNDVSAFRADPAMARVAARAERVVLMHRLGDSSKTMQDNPRYADVVAEVRAFLAQRLRAFADAGGDPARAWVDPGIGFGKEAGHNLALIREIGGLSKVAPVLLGVSRKSFLGRIGAGADPEERLPASLALAVWAGFAGVDVLRVHDVAPTKRALAALASVAAEAR